VGVIVPKSKIATVRFNLERYLFRKKEYKIQHTLKQDNGAILLLNDNISIDLAQMDDYTRD